MNNSIQYFVENGIPGLEKSKKDFLNDPACFDVYIEKVKNIMLDFGSHIISEVLEECNTLLEESLKRRQHWHVKDRHQKNIMTPVGMLSFIRTRFKNKETKETAYLLDRIVGIAAHARMSGGVKAAILEEAVQTSYEKAGKEACPGECVSKETVMRYVHGMEIPSKNQETPGQPSGKKKVKNIYVEADEDHAALQFHEKKGDIKRFKGHADNTQIVKLVYVHEGYTDGKRKRKELKNVVYFGGLYHGKDNEKLWNEVKRYIGKQYEEEKIYFQSDGGAWMKKGIEILGAGFVLDGFHIQKYIRKMAHLSGNTEKEAEENRKKIQEWVKKGKRKELEEWTIQIKTGMPEKKQKKLEESWKYIKNNWKGIRKRVKKEDEGIIGSSTESHISHVLSSRLSSRPKGWSREGMDKMAQLRVYWKNGGSMMELVIYQKKEKITEETEEEKYFSATEIVTWEKKHRKTNGKYIEALRASISHQISAKIFFNTAIAGLF